MSTYDGSKVWLIVRDGQVKIRIGPSSNPFVRDGKLWVKIEKGTGAVVDGALAKQDGVIDQVTAAAKKLDWAAIDPKYLAGPGESPSGLLIITEAEWTERKRQEAGKELCGRQLKVSKSGKPVLQHDVRDQLDLEVTILGHRWKVDSLGQPFDYGHAHKTRYAYLTLIGPAETADYTDYSKLLELADEENARWHREFNAMMDDEQNDGVNPPRAESQLFRKLAEQMEAANPRLKLERKVRAQADESPETTTGYLRGQAGKRALKLLGDGADESAVIAELESYKSDPAYIDAAWG